MSALPRVIELNEPARRAERATEFKQHLINASNELYLHEMLCEAHSRPFPPALKRAHSSIRAELKRIESSE